MTPQNTFKREDMHMPATTPVSVPTPSFVKIDGMQRVVKPSSIVAVTNQQGTNVKVHLADSSTHTVSRRFRFEDLAEEIRQATGTSFLRIRAHGVVGTVVFLNLSAVVSFANFAGGLAIYMGAADPLLLTGFVASDIETALVNAGYLVGSVQPVSASSVAA